MSITYYKVEDNHRGGLCSRAYEHPVFVCAFRTREEALDAAEQWLRESRFWHWEEETQRVDPESTHIERSDYGVAIVGFIQVRDWPPGIEVTERVVVDGEEYSRKVVERPDPGPWNRKAGTWHGYSLEVEEYGLVWWDERDEGSTA